MSATLDGHRQTDRARGEFASLTRSELIQRLVRTGGLIADWKNGLARLQKDQHANPCNCLIMASMASFVRMIDQFQIEYLQLVKAALSQGNAEKKLEAVK